MASCCGFPKQFVKLNMHQQMDLHYHTRNKGGAVCLFCYSELEHSIMHTAVLIESQVTKYKISSTSQMSNTCNRCINNSKQQTLKEAMAMHILNASSESVVSYLGRTTVHWSVQLGSKWLALPVYQQYLYMRIRFTQDTKVWQCTDSD